MNIDATATAVAAVAVLRAVSTRINRTNNKRGICKVA